MPKILIVEDSIEWIKSHIQTIHDAFGNDFFEIRTSFSARDGFVKATENLNNPYDLIITDLEMEKIFDEGYAGSWLIRNLRGIEALNETRILIISSAHNIQEIAEGFKVDCISKSQLISNPNALVYKLEEIFGIELS